MPVCGPNCFSIQGNRTSWRNRFLIPTTVQGKFKESLKHAMPESKNNNKEHVGRISEGQSSQLEGASNNQRCENLSIKRMTAMGWYYIYKNPWAHGDTLNKKTTHWSHKGTTYYSKIWLIKGKKNQVFILSFPQ